ncbi:transcriptional regulatory protein WalR [Clostridium tepidiprofundi DSM 19306]|uniref:Stage 0 sporulation protein A homolog n=1 Tax=Clostridium tepidiprofundi DSM 19306 TaxID=1121338 RepID=A0A151B4M7_9CLOT|nr:response regulator transcription factor [Clostridium tepidiprofundi]KYH34858.1 transcriptional regulatory protein WalR [Clostridium tepidiprofundi DSM 19306]
MYKILVVEDDESLGRGLQFALQKEGFEVNLARTLSEGKSYFYSTKNDLILLDVMLPDGNGFEFCKEIRKESDIAIIFLTACDEEVNVVLGLDIGADDYITKPFRVRELISRIKAILRRSEKINKMHTNSIKCNDLVFYSFERKLIKNGKEIMLTTMEYKLIDMFLNNPMRILSRNNILEKLWDLNGEFVDDNTLSVYIRRLREKIEDDASHPQYITTVRGIGYKWNKRCS